MRVHVAQIGQLLDRGLHRGGRGVHRRHGQPGQPAHPQPGIELKQPVQIRAHLSGQQMRYLPEGQLTRPGAGHPDHLHQRHHARPDHLRRDQVLGRQAEQQRRRIMFHRPVQQELLQLLHRRAVRRRLLPPQVPGRQLQVTRTVCARRPYPCSSAESMARRSASRVTATGGAAVTAPGTNPSHGSVHTWTASPSRSPGPRPRPGSTNATSAPVSVKYRIRSSLPMSGYDRSWSS